MSISKKRQKRTRKQKARRKQTKKHTKKHTRKCVKRQSKYLGGEGTEVYTPKDHIEMRKTIEFYNINKWDDEAMKDLPEYKGPISSWDVSNVKMMRSMFSGCSSFNQPLDKWNVSKVTDMSYMFTGCSSFNQPINNWNVSNVENMRTMFSGCSSFDQPLNNWDVSKVTDMGAMFSSCRSFNQPLDNWNVSNVKDMSNMFQNCSSFNQSLDNWTTKLGGLEKIIDTYGKDMFDGCNNFNTDLFYTKLYQGTFDTEDELNKLFTLNHILILIQTYNKYKNIENLTICHAIFLYNNVGDVYINGLLRDNNEIKNKLNPKLKEFFARIIHTLDDYFINNAPKSTKGMVVYRGEKILCEGNTCRAGIINSYSSTTTNSKTVLQFTNMRDCCLYEYQLDEGIPYIDFTKIMNLNTQRRNCKTDLSLKFKENEFLLPRGIELKYMKETKPQKNIRYFEMAIGYDSTYIQNNPLSF